MSPVTGSFLHTEDARARPSANGRSSTNARSKQAETWVSVPTDCARKRARCGASLLLVHGALIIYAVIRRGRAQVKVLTMVRYRSVFEQGFQQAIHLFCRFRHLFSHVPQLSCKPSSFQLPRPGLFGSLRFFWFGCVSVSIWNSGLWNLFHVKAEL